MNGSLATTGRETVFNSSATWLFDYNCRINETNQLPFPRGKVTSMHTLVVGDAESGLKAMIYIDVTAKATKCFCLSISDAKSQWVPASNKAGGKFKQSIQIWRKFTLSTSLIGNLLSLVWRHSTDKPLSLQVAWAEPWSMFMGFLLQGSCWAQGWQCTFHSKIGPKCFEFVSCHLQK